MKHIPVKVIDNNDSWLQSFEKHLENRRSNETSVKTKKKRLTVLPDKSLSGVDKLILKQNDINNLEIIFDDESIIETDNYEDDPGTRNNPILTIVPPNDQVTSTSGTQNSYISPDREDIEDVISSLMVNDFIQVKYLYYKNTKKSMIKQFVCQVKNISKSIKVCLYFAVL